MKFETLLSLVRSLPCFDLATVVQLTGDRRESVIHQLYRFSKAGKIIALRRGMYALAEPYRTVAVQPAELAGMLYRPSYLSDVWALANYGIIPEAVTVFTSVTTRRPRQFRNAFGEFRYKNVKKSMFFAYSSVELIGRKVILATPEKALVDLWYLSQGEWTADRMREMRFSSDEILDENLLAGLIEKINKPRLQRAFEIWKRMRLDDEEGEAI
jgi:predicted transcriptional regulator of viral defense system